MIRTWVCVVVFLASFVLGSYFVDEFSQVPLPQQSRAEGPSRKLATNTQASEKKPAKKTELIPIPTGYDSVRLPMYWSDPDSAECRPGTHVDVIFLGTDSKTKKAQSRCLLRDVLIVTPDLVHPSQDGKLRELRAYVAVALKPRDILKLKTAQRVGKLILMIRDPKTPAQTKFNATALKRLRDFDPSAQWEKKIQPTSPKINKGN